MLLADDHPVVLEGIQRLVSAQGNMDVVGLARDGEQAVDLAMELRPDVVVLDLSMPKMSGVMATTRIRAACPGTAVIALSVHVSQQVIDDALAAGARCYVTKRCPTAEVVHAIRVAAAGGTYLSSDIASPCPAQDSHSATGRAPGRLSPRERQVLQQIAQEHEADRGVPGPQRAYDQPPPGADHGQPAPAYRR